MQWAACLEGLNPVRVPSWLSEGKWAEPGTVPGPSAHSQLCPYPATDSLHHATQEPGSPPKPSPVTRAHGHKQGEVTGRQEVRTDKQKANTSDVQRAGAEDKRDDRRRNCCGDVQRNRVFLQQPLKTLKRSRFFFFFFFF